MGCWRFWIGGSGVGWGVGEFGGAGKGEGESLGIYCGLGWMVLRGSRLDEGCWQGRKDVGKGRLGWR